jgi:hypothetical protein
MDKRGVHIGIPLELHLVVFHSFGELLRYSRGLQNFLNEAKPRHLYFSGGFQETRV